VIPRLNELRDFAAETAYRAGRFTLGYFGCVDSERKDDSSLVTEADRGAERLIREAIEKAYPDHAVLGEEFGEKAGEGVRWVVDPIDGTKAFVRGVPTYAVLIGAVVDGEPQVGAAYLPATDEMVTAAEGHGALWNSRKARVSARERLSDALLLTGDLKLMYKHGRGDAYERLREASAENKCLPDAYGHLLVATGRADVMTDPIVNPWDIAALIPIVREAGGSLTDWSGDPTFFRPEAISTNGLLLAEVLGCVAG
jgi:histidinol-phosphatase